MYNVGFELMTPDSRGRCSHHCAMEDLQFSGNIFPIYSQPISIMNLNTDKTVSKQSELLFMSATSVNTRGVPIVPCKKRRNCQNELARLPDALCPLKQ